MMPWSMEQKIFFVKTYYETKFFPDCSSKVQKEVQLQQISKQESDFQVGQEVWNSWHLWRS